MAEPRPDEHAEQIVVVEYMKLRHPKVRFFAVPNGGQRNKVVAAQLKAEGVSPGVPDLVFPTARGGYFGLYLEMKKRELRGWPKPVTRDNQTEWLDYLGLEGYETAVCYGANEAIETIDAYMSMRKTRAA